MIDIRKLKELVKLMVQNDLTEMDLRDSEEQVTLQRPNQLAAPQVLQAAPPPSVAVPPPAAAPAAASAPAPAAPPAANASSGREGLVAIESPMVGTYYSASSPDADPFITVGKDVGDGSVVCLIEAMKIFNEIKSEVTGTVVQILVSNGDAVEFGQELVLVRPA
ncbi:MAG: acetyl-CoA carboxylase biotin carboxyl carrier protein [Phycisphaerales bacterium]|jgi:acetyl-CoA carboxylase biotin carboxyl carrier protein|nr:acetyl-CoA carboxylase biotin carboxyl carrier protein [Phycisphaerales bacterium]